MLNLLYCELVSSHRDTVDKLHGAPEAVEFNTLVHVHDAVAGKRSAPDRVIQEATYACEDDLEHGEAAAQPLFGQQVAFTRNCNLLSK